MVLEAVTNADNVGGVFRNAAAFGADAVLLSPTCCDPFYRKAIRTSMGATLRVPFAQGVRLAGGAWRARRRGLRGRGADAAAAVADARRVRDDAQPGRVALVVGTEGPGLSQEAEALADHRVSIRMRSDVDSLNLAVAVGHCAVAHHGRVGRVGQVGQAGRAGIGRQ